MVMFYRVALGRRAHFGRFCLHRERVRLPFRMDFAATLCLHSFGPISRTHSPPVSRPVVLGVRLSTAQRSRSRSSSERSVPRC